MQFISILLLWISPVFAGPVALTDNVLFAFEKCRELQIDLEKGQLKESRASSFDIHCRKKKALEFECTYFDTGSEKKIREEIFKGGSDLGVAELKSAGGNRLKFLIGKPYVSFHSGTEPLVCAGIYLYEQDALKQKKR